jgi:hypothetical protein
MLNSAGSGRADIISPEGHYHLFRDCDLVLSHGRTLELTDGADALEMIFYNISM